MNYKKIINWTLVIILASVPVFILNDIRNNEIDDYKQKNIALVSTIDSIQVNITFGDKVKALMTDNILLHQHIISMDYIDKEPIPKNIVECVLRLHCISPIENYGTATKETGNGRAGSGRKTMKLDEPQYLPVHDIISFELDTFDIKPMVINDDVASIKKDGTLIHIVPKNLYHLTDRVFVNGHHGMKIAKTFMTWNHYGKTIRHKQRYPIWPMSYMTMDNRMRSGKKNWSSWDAGVHQFIRIAESLRDSLCPEDFITYDNEIKHDITLSKIQKNILKELKNYDR